MDGEGNDNIVGSSTIQVVDSSTAGDASGVQDILLHEGSSSLPDQEMYPVQQQGNAEIQPCGTSQQHSADCEVPAGNYQLEMQSEADIETSTPQEVGSTDVIRPDDDVPGIGSSQVAGSVAPGSVCLLVEDQLPSVRVASGSDEAVIESSEKLVGGYEVEEGDNVVYGDYTKSSETRLNPDYSPSSTEASTSGLQRHEQVSSVSLQPQLAETISSAISTSLSSQPIFIEDSTSPQAVPNLEEKPSHSTAPDSSSQQNASTISHSMQAEYQSSVWPSESTASSDSILNMPEVSGSESRSNVAGEEKKRTGSDSELQVVPDSDRQGGLSEASTSSQRDWAGSSVATQAMESDSQEPQQVPSSSDNLQQTPAPMETDAMSQMDVEFAEATSTQENQVAESLPGSELSQVSLELGELGSARKETVTTSEEHVEVVNSPQPEPTSVHVAVTEEPQSSLQQHGETASSNVNLEIPESAEQAVTTSNVTAQPMLLTSTTAPTRITVQIATSGSDDRSNEEINNLEEAGPSGIDRTEPSAPDTSNSATTSETPSQTPFNADDTVTGSIPQAQGVVTSTHSIVTCSSDKVTVAEGPVSSVQMQNSPSSTSVGYTSNKQPTIPQQPVNIVTHTGIVLSVQPPKAATPQLPIKKEEEHDDSFRVRTSASSSVESTPGTSLLTPKQQDVILPQESDQVEVRIVPTEQIVNVATPSIQVQPSASTTSASAAVSSTGINKSTLVRPAQPQHQIISTVPVRNEPEEQYIILEDDEHIQQILTNAAIQPTAVQIGSTIRNQNEIVVQQQVPSGLQEIPNMPQVVISDENSDYVSMDQEPEQAVMQQPIQTGGSFIEIPLSALGVEGSGVFPGLMVSEDGTSVEAEVDGQLVRIPVTTNAEGIQVIHIQTSDSGAEDGSSHVVQIEVQHPNLEEEMETEEADTIQVLTTDSLEGVEGMQIATSALGQQIILQQPQPDSSFNIHQAVQETRVINAANLPNIQSIQVARQPQRATPTAIPQEKIVPFPKSYSSSSTSTATNTDSSVRIIQLGGSLQESQSRTIAVSTSSVKSSVQHSVFTPVSADSSLIDDTSITYINPEAYETSNAGTSTMIPHHIMSEESSQGFPGEYIVPDDGVPEQTQTSVGSQYQALGDVPAEEESRSRPPSEPPATTVSQVSDAIGAGTSSLLTPESMQALIQVLQSLPAAAKGQTIQIVLQTSAQDDENDQGFTAGIVTENNESGNDVQVVHITTPGSASKKATCEMGVQTGEKRPRPPTSPKPPGVGRGRKPKSQPSTPPPPPISPHPDVKPGVSYYAVVDYLSEQEDGYQSGNDLKRPEAPVAGFMEDHLELQADLDETRNRFVLESTIDSTTYVSPYGRRKFKIVTVTEPGASIDLPVVANQSLVTLQERSLEQALIEGLNLAEQSSHPIRGQKTAAYMSQSRLLSKVPRHGCGYCDFSHKHKIYVVQHCEVDHAGLPLKTINLLPRMGTRHCPFCKQTYDASEFFQHMRVAHSEVHPMKCGYCDFLGRDRNQVKHHIRKKHIGCKYKIINIISEGVRSQDLEREGRKKIMAASDGEDTVYEYLTDDEDDIGASESEWKSGIQCPECKRPFKTLKYLKSHIRVHQRHRFQCGYCDFISIVEHHVLKHSERKHKKMEPRVISRDLEPEKYPLVSRNIENVLLMVGQLAERLPKDPDETKWRRKWFCPHCDYACQFGASYRRHLRMHANILPYKCNYCSFKGREKYYVRRHLQRMHSHLPAVVVDNTPENCLQDSSSDEDFQEKGLRRKRKRKTKRVLHAVVPLDQCMEMELQVQGEGRKRGWKRKIPPQPIIPKEELLLADLPFLVKTESDQEMAPKKLNANRLPRAEEWSGESISDYKGTREGGKITCKVCGQKTLEKAFYKHARKHFRVKPFKCGYCDYISIERAKIRVHITLRHPDMEFNIEERHLVSMSPEDIVKLMGAELPEEALRVDESAKSSFQENVRFSCPVCQDLVAYEEEDIRGHFYAHFDYMPFQCGYCDYRDVYKHRIEIHADAHDRPVYIIDSGMQKPEGLDDMVKAFLDEGEKLQHVLSGGIPQAITPLPPVEIIPERRVIPEATRKPPPVEKKRPKKANVEKTTYQCSICDRSMNCHAVTVKRHMFGHFDYKPFQCGYCDFKAGSTGEVKQHTAKHGSVKPEIIGTGEKMPQELEKLLQAFINEVYEHKLAKKKELDAERTTIKSVEGKRWKDLMEKGVCPWCDEKVEESDCFNHLREHFNYKPFMCGHCGFKGSNRIEVKKHIVSEHHNMKMRIQGPVRDTWDIEKGLRAYHLQKQSPKDPKIAENQESKMAEKEIKTEVQEVKEENEQTETVLGIGDESGHENGNIPSGPVGDSKKAEDSDLSDEDIMEVTDTGAVLLMRAFKSDTEYNTGDTDSEGGEDFQDMPSDKGGKKISNLDVTKELVRDIQILLNMSLTKEGGKSSDDERGHQCPHCDRAFSQLSGLRQHVKSSHPGNNLEYGCAYCSFTQSNKEAIKKHILQSHKKKPIFIKDLFSEGNDKRKRESDGESSEGPSTKVQRVTRASAKSDEEGEMAAPKGKRPKSPKDNAKTKSESDIEEKMITDEVVEIVASTSTAVEKPMTPTRSSERVKQKSSVDVQGKACPDKKQQPATKITKGKPEEDRIDSLENLEECDENLPKMLTFIQLQSSKPNSEKND